MRRLNRPNHHRFRFWTILRRQLVSLQLPHNVGLVLQYLVLSHDRYVLTLDTLVLHKGPILVSLPIWSAELLSGLNILREAIQKLLIVQRMFTEILQIRLILGLSDLCWQHRLVCDARNTD